MELGLSECKTIETSHRFRKFFVSYLYNFYLPLQTFPERLQIAWIKLQTDVNCLMDSTSDKALNAPSGIKQVCLWVQRSLLVTVSIVPSFITHTHTHTHTHTYIHTHTRERERDSGKTYYPAIY